jgi:hypothetical protein
MRRLQYLLIILPATLMTAALLAQGHLVGPPAPDAEQNRRQLKKWQADPKNYARLLNELRAFLTQSPERQQDLRALHQALARVKPSVRARLFEVMERYADWLDRLPPDERREVEQAITPRERLQVIRRLRQKQWIDQLPQADRDRVARAQGPERDRLLAQLRQRDRQRRREWAAALRNLDVQARRRPGGRWLETPEMKTFLKEYLRPRLNDQEKRRLDTVATNRKARLPFVLVELADRHPLALPGERGPVHFKDLPAEVRKKLRNLDNLMKAPVDQQQNPRLVFLRQRALQAEGHWPQFGMIVARFGRLADIKLPYELWPSRKKDLSGPVRLFLEFDLEPALTSEEKTELQKAEGQGWPAFPTAIHKLADKYHLRVPWQTLPGVRRQWDGFRPAGRLTASYLPPVPRHILRTFAEVELTAEDRTKLGLTPFEPPNWERLRQEYFRRKPEELKRLREAEYGKGK